MKRIFFPHCKMKISHIFYDYMEVGYILHVLDKSIPITSKHLKINIVSLDILKLVDIFGMVLFN